MEDNMQIKQISDLPDCLLNEIEFLSKSLDIRLSDLIKNYPPPEGSCYAVGKDNKLHIYPIIEDEET
jgi:hypothetical protein